MYLLNYNFLRTQKIRKGLVHIYGIGDCFANQICDQLGFYENMRFQDLTGSQREQLVRVITQYYFTGSELKRLLTQDIQRLNQIGCYAGFRHALHLPVRGQRTKTNARTVRALKQK
jgi:small subunit ribosomal protein S13